LQSEPEEPSPTPTTSRNTGVEAEDPLPPGWATAVAPNGRVFFIDHNTKATTWVGTLCLSLPLLPDIKQLCLCRVKPLVAVGSKKVLFAFVYVVICDHRV